MMGGVLSDVLPYLVCPLCGADLKPGDGFVRCADGHSFDVARQGYVNLLPGGAQTGTADTPAMVEARAAFLAEGHFGSLAGLLAECTTACTGDSGFVLDAGAGTGYYLAAVLDGIPPSTTSAAPTGTTRSSAPAGAAFDISKFAARRAARAHPRIGAVVWDLWRDLPVRSGTARAVLNVFAPRNAPEYRRILRRDGALILVTPTPRHLRELIRPLGLLSVDEEKARRVDEVLGEHFGPATRQDHEIDLCLPRRAVQTLACMGPSAWHLTPAEVHERLTGLAGTDPIPVTASFTVTVYRPRG
jgi:23S rRNA (guanine745-N1)-methyltransferase